MEPEVRQRTRPTWAEVSLGALQHNFHLVQQHVGAGVAVCAVVKADAYGHGARMCARALEAAGACWLGVTGPDEGDALRNAGIKARILLMTGFWRGEEDDVLSRDLTPAVWEPEQITLLQQAALRRGVVYPVHLKVDTGMGRLGVPMEDLPAVCEALVASPNLRLEGVMTHLGASEIMEAMQGQKACFEEAQAVLHSFGLYPELVHMANSGATLGRPDTWKNFVRPGLLLYGYSPQLWRGGKVTDEVPPLAVQPVLEWKTRIISVKRAAVGQGLGYGRTLVTARSSRIAALPVGYADGLNRALSNRGRVIVRGHYAPIVGMISMDLTLVDVTDIPGVEAGDDVTLLGRSGACAVDAVEHAAHCATVPYEILCAISKRVPRKYVD